MIRDPQPPTTPLSQWNQFACHDVQNHLTAIYSMEDKNSIVFHAGVLPYALLMAKTQQHCHANVSFRAMWRQEN